MVVRSVMRGGHRKRTVIKARIRLKMSVGIRGG